MGAEAEMLAELAERNRQERAELDRKVLATLQRGGELYAGDVAERCGMKRSKARAILARLVRFGRATSRLVPSGEHRAGRSPRIYFQAVRP